MLRPAQFGLASCATAQRSQRGRLDLSRNCAGSPEPVSPCSPSIRKDRSTAHDAGSLLFRAYVASHPPRALRTVDMTLAFQGVPSVRCDPTSQGEFTHRYAESDVRRIRAYDLDFLLQCGLGILGGEILHVARYGVWSFQHDDEPPYRGIPPCLWPIYDADAVTRAVLRRVAGRGGGIALRTGYFRTALHSLRQNVDEVHFGALGWPANVCQDL